MKMSEEERFKQYSTGVLLGNSADYGDRERQPYHQMRLKEPMFAAMCYAYGYTDHQSTVRAFEEEAETFREQVSNIKKQQSREPKLVLDIGAGRGELTAAFLYDNVKCIAVDPSIGSRDVVPMTLEKWIGETNTAYFQNQTLLDAVSTARLMRLHVDTIIFCESIEHILEEEFNQAFPFMEQMLTENHGRLIITNWVGFHPINPDNSGWDHIREINDSVYNTLVGQRNTKILQRGSHLVVAY